MAEKIANNLKFTFPYTVEEWAENMYIENYHKHTTWSNIFQADSATSLELFMKKAYNNKCKCMFSGEHGYQGEWLLVYDKCNSVKVNKDLGIETPLKFRYSTEAYFVKNRLENDSANCHIVLVARTYRGIRMLNYLISVACEHPLNGGGFYFKPRLDIELLKQLSPDDVYVTSACIGGWKYEDAEEVWLSIWEHFGDSFFFEYQCNNTDKQKELNERIYRISQKHGIQTIIGLDTHYLDEEDKVKRLNVLKRKNISYPEEEGWYMDFPDGKEVYRRMIEQGVLSEEEILRAMMNTCVFIDGCDDIHISKHFKIPDTYEELSDEEKTSHLKKMFMDRFMEEEDQTKERLEAIEYEHEQIIGSGTADYFLTNDKIISLATSPKYNGVLTTTSRGSAASYYTSKLLRFTTMDRFESEVPIYPERFITKERILESHQCPDIDYNVAEQEPFVLATKELLGEHGCYPLLAVGTYKEKSAWKLYADINGIDPKTANEVSSYIDKYNEDLKNTDDDEDKKNINIEDYIPEEYIDIYMKSKDYQSIVENGRCHACGHLIFNGDKHNPNVIGYGDIRYEIGLIRCHSENGKSVMVACIEGSLLDSYGYVKNDYLIVDVVAIIKKLFDSIEQPVPTVNQLRKMVDGDEKTWDIYAKGITCCVNQCEKEATTKKVMIYKPKNIKELSAFIAAIRPGFKSHIEGFLHRKPYSNGEKAIDDLLSDCFNYMIYQEAIMKIFTYLGIPMKDSYDTIKGISKKKLVGEKLKELEDSLKQHWLEKIGNNDNFEPVYQIVKDSGRYAFNAPHANAMAFDSLYEAYFKAHYTSKFYEVTLNHYMDKGNKNKVNALLNEAREFFGYTVDKYTYGRDNSRFIVDDENKVIHPNLACIKGIGEQVVLDMLEIYRGQNEHMVDIYLNIKGTKVSRTVLKNLIKIDYFRELGTQKKLLQQVEIIEKWTSSGGEPKKTISKADIEELGLHDIEIEEYATDILKSGRKSDKQYSIFDWKGLVKVLCDNVSDEEFSLCDIIKNQMEVLGYIDYVDPNIDKRYVLITELDTTYSPKFKGYCLNNGKSEEIKIHRKPKGKWRDNEVKVYYEDCPVKEGDILYMKKIKAQPKQTKGEDGKWVEVVGTKEWWLKDYVVVKNI